MTPELVQVERKWKVNFVESGCFVQTRDTTTTTKFLLISFCEQRFVTDIKHESLYRNNQYFHKKNYSCTGDR